MIIASYKLLSKKVLFEKKRIWLIEAQFAEKRGV